MKLEQQVCSLELAKRLKELGVKQESLVKWDTLGDHAELSYGYSTYPGLVRYAAFTVAELGEMLPEAFLWEGVTQVGLHCGKYTGGWHVYYKSAGKRIHYEDGKTEVAARAKMLIYLLENKLITFP
jgi:hypothetical protein